MFRFLSEHWGAVLNGDITTVNTSARSAFMLHHVGRGSANAYLRCGIPPGTDRHRIQESKRTCANFPTFFSSGGLLTGFPHALAGQRLTAPPQPRAKDKPGGTGGELSQNARCAGAQVVLKRTFTNGAKVKGPPTPTKWEIWHSAQRKTLNLLPIRVSRAGVRKTYISNG